ncbi:hypothetical protein [Lachnotalea glycerini]|uniref:hypothetical protein n=1 Tax=Lachnotalea glycerini TaxID=1763509 RepID=UPI001FA8CA18|nr:hypothetical protein [Lachnotalea glycerini]
MLFLKKYKESGIDNVLFDAPGLGRNPEITDEEKAWIINIYFQKPTDFVILQKHGHMPIYRPILTKLLK